MSWVACPRSSVRQCYNRMYKLGLLLQIVTNFFYPPRSLIFQSTPRNHYPNPRNRHSGKFLPEFSTVRIVRVPAPAAGSSKSAHRLQLLLEISMFGKATSTTQRSSKRNEQHLQEHLAQTLHCKEPREYVAAAARMTLHA